MIDFFTKGGIFMYPILLCSVTALTIFLERLWNLRRHRVIPLGFIKEVEELVRRQKLPEAAMFCQQNRSSIARILIAAIKNFGRSRQTLKEHMEEMGRQEGASLERFVEGLGTIASISTLLGLLGTISGMIKIFSVVSVQTVIDPGSLAGGISEALVTTYAGLSVAIPTMVMYKYLQGKTHNLMLEMEQHSLRVVEMLKEKETGH